MLLVNTGTFFRNVIFLTLAVVLTACGNSGGGSDGGDGGGTSAGIQVDIVIAIDSSGTMADEVEWVEAELNMFANMLTAANIDPRIHVIVGSGTFCVTPPLGSGSCPADSSAPGYQHYNQVVNSHNALDVILATHSSWGGAIRSGAEHVFMVVSDDDSSSTFSSFNTDLLNLDPALAGYRFHGIAASVDPNFLDPANKCNFVAIAEGSEYIAMANATGGVVMDLCDQNFSTAFTQIALAIVADYT